MLRVLMRAFVYLLLAVLLAEILRWEMLYVERRWQYSEFGLVEWAQSAFLLASVVLLLFNARRSVDVRQLSVCMAVLFGVLLIRENDQILELVFVHGVWKYIALLVVVPGVVYWSRNRAAVASQATDYARTPSFGLLLGGFVVLVFSRLFGRSSYWEALLGQSYVRIAKNAAEEGIEFLALALMLTAVIEFVLPGRQRSTRE